MSTRLVAILLATLVPLVAHAETKLDAPPGCTEVGTIPPSAKIPAPGTAARIALAMCVAEKKFTALHLTPDDAGIAAITDAAKQSFDLIDEAIAQNDPFWASYAQKARVALHIAMAIRMRNSVPPITATMTTAELVQHDQAHAALEPKLKPWLDSR